jgi:SP family general alpha glucoside:H+ symporter-like MFS transporter
MTDGARAAADSERNMTIRHALKTCRKGLFWSLIFTTAVIMEGFDLALLSGFYAFTAFKVSQITQHRISHYFLTYT